MASAAMLLTQVHLKARRDTSKRLFIEPTCLSYLILLKAWWERVPHMHIRHCLSLY